MSDKTAIEWTDATWNPVRGCSRVSPGCGGPNRQGGCYAEGIAARFSGPGQPFEGFAERTAAGGRWTGKVELVPSALDLPLRWRKPRRIFANSMSDLFHEHLGIDDIATVYGTAIAAARLRGHTIQILTKRAERMNELLHEERFWDLANDRAEQLVLEHGKGGSCEDYGPDEPPPGIWLGVSVEDQPRAHERISYLVDTPAAIRFLSCEPLLGPLDLLPWLFIFTHEDNARLASDEANPVLPFNDPETTPPEDICTPRVDWVIAGGESGPRARPVEVAWVRALRDQCQQAEVPFFFKQWGEWAPLEGTGLVSEDPAARPRDDVYRIGKKRAGATLDGREWREMPA